MKAYYLAVNSSVSRNMKRVSSYILYGRLRSHKGTDISMNSRNYLNCLYIYMHEVQYLYNETISFCMEEIVKFYCL